MARVQRHTIAAVVVMAVGIGIVSQAGPSVAAPTAASQKSSVQYQPGNNVALPSGPFTSFEVSTFDPWSHAVYVADPDNKQIDVIDAKTGTARPPITGFAGSVGVLVTPDTHELWVGDGDATIKVVDLKTMQIVASIPSGGTGQVDTLAYDAKDHIMLSQSHDENPPFVLLISTKSRTALGTIPMDAETFIEQPVWDPVSDRFYVNILKTTENPGGEVDVVDPLKRSITTVYPIPSCLPLGSALGPHRELYVACGNGGPAILDTRNGKVLARLTQIGQGSEVAYNPTTKQYIQPTRPSTGATLYIVDARSRSVAQTLPLPDGARAGSVAVDPSTDHIFVPEVGSGVQIFVPKGSR
jgi:DNA-binding beta-propeller fold protein YncE